MRRHLAIRSLCGNRHGDAWLLRQLALLGPRSCGLQFTTRAAARAMSVCNMRGRAATARDAHGGSCARGGLSDPAASDRRRCGRTTVTARKQSATAGGGSRAPRVAAARELRPESGRIGGPRPRVESEAYEHLPEGGSARMAARGLNPRKHHKSGGPNGSDQWRSRRTQRQSCRPKAAAHWQRGLAAALGQYPEGGS
jgi:hypothetical protein